MSIKSVIESLPFRKLTEFMHCKDVKPDLAWNERSNVSVRGLLIYKGSKQTTTMKVYILFTGITGKTSEEHTICSCMVMASRLNICCMRRSIRTALIRSHRKLWILRSSSLYPWFIRVKRWSMVICKTGSGRINGGSREAVLVYWKLPQTGAASSAQFQSSHSCILHKETQIPITASWSWSWRAFLKFSSRETNPNRSFDRGFELG
jgi:hypothetical protein